MKTHLLLFLGGIGAATAPTSVAAQYPLNLDFEMRAVQGSAPKAWGWQRFGAGAEEGLEVALDARVRRSGRHSLRVERVAGTARPHLLGQVLDVDMLPLRGKRLRLSGWVRTENVQGGQAGLVVQTWLDKPPVRLDTMPGGGSTGTTPWRQYAIELTVDSSATELGVGVHFGGAGVAWFDDLVLEIDGQRVETHPTAGRPLTASEREWLRRAARPLKGVDAGGGFADLGPLKTLIGDARLIGIGEGTHGTSEFRRMMHRLTEFAAAELGATVSAIEADQAVVERVNRYVLAGEGDPRLAMVGMYDLWHTSEMLDMVQWARRYNASGRGRLEFVGYDMVEPRLAMDSVLRFLSVADSGFRGTADSIYRSLRAPWERGIRERGAFALPESTTTRWHQAATAVHAHVQMAKAEYLRQGVDTLRWARALQYANLVRQAAGYIMPRNVNRLVYRDSAMAENLLWELARRPPGTRAVIAAHNEHITKRQGRMGWWLDRLRPGQYVAIAQLTHSGTYSADTTHGRPLIGRRYVPRDLFPAPPLSLEGLLHGLGHPYLMLDLRAARGDSVGQLLNEPRIARLIGATALDYGFRAGNVNPRLFDAVVFSDRTRHTVMLSCPMGLICGG